LDQKSGKVGKGGKGGPEMRRNNTEEEGKKERC